MSNNASVQVGVVGGPSTSVPWVWRAGARGGRQHRAQSGDTITFGFEAYDPVRHVGSTLAKKHDFQMVAVNA